MAATATLQQLKDFAGRLNVETDVERSPDGTPVLEADTAEEVAARFADVEVAIGDDGLSLGKGTAFVTTRCGPCCCRLLFVVARLARGTATGSHLVVVRRRQQQCALPLLHSHSHNIPSPPPPPPTTAPQAHRLDPVGRRRRRL
jgi:hypothetical protein